MANEISDKSSMATRLDKSFKDCGAIKGEQIAVPGNVLSRMDNLCSDTKKIIKDIPNKKFLAAATINANSKAVGYYNKVKEGIDRAYDNIKSFLDLKAFYGVYGNNVRSSVKAYSRIIDEYHNKINSIILEVNNKLKSNPKIENKLQGQIIDGLDLRSIAGRKGVYEQDEKLIESGKLVENLQGSKENYEDYVEGFFDYLMKYKVESYEIKHEDKEQLIKRNDANLIQLFQDVSYSLRRLKTIVANNEEDISNSNGINTSRNSAAIKMKNVLFGLNEFEKDADEGIAFLEDLDIKNESLEKKRLKALSELNEEKEKYKSKISDIKELKSSILYGETKIKFENGNIGYASNKCVLAGNTMRETCNRFILDLNEVLGIIKKGVASDKIFKMAKNLCSAIKLINKNAIGFIQGVNDFGGYFTEKTERNQKILSVVQSTYDGINKDLENMQKDVDNIKKSDKMAKLQEKLAREVKDYNKTSSKIIRGTKKAGVIALNITKYAFLIKTFISSMLSATSGSMLIVNKIDGLIGNLEKAEAN